MSGNKLMFSVFVLLGGTVIVADLQLRGINCFGSPQLRPLHILRQSVNPQDQRFKDLTGRDALSRRSRRNPGIRHEHDQVDKNKWFSSAYVPW